MSDVAQLSVTVDQISATASKGQAREHTLVMDRPEAKGGENRGVSGGETMLMAFGGCFMSNLLAAVKTRESDVRDIKLSITGTLGTTPPCFTAVELVISAAYGDKAELEKLAAIALRGCFVGNTLKKALDLKIVLA